MLTIEKKLVVNGAGEPQEVIITWAQYQQIVEMLGLDLDEEAVGDLRQAQREQARNGQTAQDEQAPDSSSLADLLNGYVGVIHSSEKVEGGAQLSKQTGSAFAEIIRQKREEDRL